MNVLAIIQARMGSQRLPGKVMLPLGGMPVVELCARRVQRSGVPTIVAHPACDYTKILPYTGAPNVIYDRRWIGTFAHDGDENDVLGRYIACATKKSPWPDIIVRITADCPLVLPEHIQYCVGQVGRITPYYGCRHHHVRGWDVEAFTMSALLESAHDDEREHVTTGMRKRYDPKGEWPQRELSLTLDTPEDYERLQKIVAKLKDPVTASAEEILKAAEFAAIATPIDKIDTSHFTTFGAP